ncbi:MAG: putative bifunctional diguanylate cyclase/phosphodiesterase, partial [Acidimicrobiales bacterium]
MLIDLDRFKQVNDTLGHHLGDDLLVQVAGRLQAAVEPVGYLGRLGGDEFAAVLDPGLGWRDGELAAARLITALEAPFLLDGTNLGVGASVGLASFPEHADLPDALIQRADAAMYEAKRANLPWIVYRPERPGLQSRRAELGNGLSRIPDRGELVLHYQPKIDLATRGVAGVEALVRWQHPTLGLLPPAEFLPEVAAAGQLRALTTWVLDRALAQYAKWRSEGIVLPVAVNVSALDLVDPGLPGRVSSSLARHGVPASALELELTEHSQLRQPGLAVDVVSALRALGVRISLDDFGTGYSSLAYLELLPVDEIKIDKSMLDAGLTGDRAVVLRAIVSLGRELGLAIVAEGVESAEAAERLTRLGCHTAQGYHFAVPLAPENLPGWLAAYSAETVETRAGATV